MIRWLKRLLGLDRREQFEQLFPASKHIETAKIGKPIRKRKLIWRDGELVASATEFENV